MPYIDQDQDVQEQEAFQEIENIPPKTRPPVNQPSNSTPDQIKDIPVYTSPAISYDESNFNEGDNVIHERYGLGVINRIIVTGDKQLCSIQFQEYGRRLLDPKRGLKKVE